MSRKAYDGNGYLKFYQQLATNNPCYKKCGNRAKTTHLILHSTGADNPDLKRYVTPDDGHLGKNPYNNGWNNANSDTLVHAVIGKNKKGVIEAYQIAPWTKKVYGCGSGKNGSGNDFAIQVEMCEDQTLGASYAKEVYAVAVKLFAHLCKAYNISPDNIWSHFEANKKGYASAHVDPEHWWTGVNAFLSMVGFRNDVKALLDGDKSNGQSTTTKTETTGTNKSGTLYRVQVGAFSLKRNAQKKLASVEADGFDACIVQDGTWYKVQVGAFGDRTNANKMILKLKAAGYSGTVVASTGKAAKKSVDEIARECISGKWGNGKDRTEALKASGYDPVAVQKKVNELLR